MNTAILISSCDAFLDCWKPMLYSIKKNWSDCPFPIYIISNFEEINDCSVTFLKVGNDLGFASNLKKALQRINYEYIIYLQEDYFIDNVVDTFSIRGHIEYCVKNNIDLLKIDNYTVLRDQFRKKNSSYCNNPIDIKYSIDTSAAIWKKTFLEYVCVDGFTGWDFERYIVPFLLKNKTRFHSEIIHSSIFPEKGIKYVDRTAICRGRWTRDGVRFLKTNGFTNLISKRKVEGSLSAFVISFYSPHSIFSLPLSFLIKILQKLNI